MKAKVLYTYEDGAEIIECNGHKIQYGYGSGGDGYCSIHESFDCIDNLTEEERAAISNAERSGGVG
jgi:hypothetical protein